MRKTPDGRPYFVTAHGDVVYGERRKPTRKRDGSRQKFYAAEDEALKFHAQQRFPTISHVEDYVRKTVLRDKWFKRIFGVVSIRVEKARGDSTHSTGGGGMIRMLPAHYVESIVLHEVAHTIRPLKGWARCVPGQASHGREYAHTYLLLVQHFMGAVAAKKLRAAFRKHKVKYTEPRKISEEQKATLRARLAGMRSERMINRQVEMIPSDEEVLEVRGGEARG